MSGYGKDVIELARSDDFTRYSLPKSPEWGRVVMCSFCDSYPSEECLLPLPWSKKTAQDSPFYQEVLYFTLSDDTNGSRGFICWVGNRTSGTQQ